MTRDELIDKLEAVGSGGSEVMIEGCCGYCNQDIEGVEMENDVIVVGGVNA